MQSRAAENLLHSDIELLGHYIKHIKGRLLAGMNSRLRVDFLRSYLVLGDRFKVMGDCSQTARFTS